MAVVSTLLWFVAGLIMVIAGIVCSVGAVLPRNHVASGSVVVPKPPNEVWELIRGSGSAPAWRKGLKSVEVTEGTAAAPVRWKEVTDRGSLAFILVKESVGRSLEIRIDDTGEPFGGTWEFELRPEGAGASLAITERGFVNPPPFRFLSRFVFGHTSTIRSYLADLKSAAGGGSEITVEG